MPVSIQAEAFQAPEGKLTVHDAFCNLLPSGGDERTFVDAATGLNKYNITLAPVPDSIMRSSSTANAVTAELVGVGETFVRELMAKAPPAGRGEQDPTAVQGIAQSVAKRLRDVWSLDDDDAVSFAASGTDAELLPLLLAVTRAQAAREEEEEKSEVLTVVAAAGEVGTSTMQAACGKIFSEVMPSEQTSLWRPPRACAPGQSSNSNLEPGERLGQNVFPLFGSVAAIEVMLRDEITGSLVPPEVLDAKIEKIVETSMLSGQYESVILHAVVGCKTGHCVPSMSCIKRLAGKYKEVIPVVDACQMRGLTGLSVRRFLRLGFVVICTGSKFYGGPPFAGAVLMPKSYVDELEGHLKRSEACANNTRQSYLKGYFDSMLISEQMPTLRSFLPSNPNYGLLLRWSMALHNIEIYHRLPEDEREQVIVRWVHGVRKLIRERSGPIALLDNAADESVAEKRDIPKNAMTIYGIGLPRTGTNSVAQALKLLGCRGMNRCVLTRTKVKHEPEGQLVAGTFDVDNSLFRTYKELYESNPKAKFVLSTREQALWAESVKRWDEQNKDRDDLKDIPPDIEAFEREVSEFFVHRRAADQLLVIDVFKMTDQELWTRMMDFLCEPNAARPFDPATNVFPRAVVQVSGKITQGGDVTKQVGDIFTSANDAELLPGQINTIVPITLRRKVVKAGKGGKEGRSSYQRLTIEELHRVHLLMALDCSQFLPFVLACGPAGSECLKKRCFIAQPVSLNLTQWSRAAYLGVLRIVLGSSTIVDAVNRKRDIQDVLKEDEIILQKLTLMLEHWAVLSLWNYKEQAKELTDGPQKKKPRLLP